MNDLERISKEQLRRLAHLEGFPRQAEAIRDYACALSVAKSEEGIKLVVDSLVVDANLTKCPTAAQIRVLAYQHAEIDQERTSSCGICGGSGVVTSWFLVTYNGRGFVGKNSKRLKLTANHENEEAMEFARKIAANPGSLEQTVLSAAEDCRCRKSA